MTSLSFILLLVLAGMLGYLITPDHTPYANEQFPELAAKPPGFSITMLLIEKNELHLSRSMPFRMLAGQKNSFVKIPVYSYRIEGDNVVYEEYTGDSPNDGAVKQLSLVDALYALPPGDSLPSEMNGTYRFSDIRGEKQEITKDELVARFQKEGVTEQRFLLGTDRFGRDLLSQLIIGSRVSLSVGLISVLISLLAGIFLGALAGYFRGWVDQLIVWFINVIWSVPTLLLVIAITFALGKGFWQVFVAVGLTMWVEVARVVRGQIMSVREKEYVEAARAMGLGNRRIIFRHILPNVMSPVIVISAANFASAILIEAGLSFLGIGVQPPVPSWGGMIREHYGYIILDASYLAIIPGTAIMLTVLAFMVFGNSLRDALDVRAVSS